MDVGASDRSPPAASNLRPPKVAQVTTVAVSVLGLMKGWPAFLKSRGCEVHTICSAGPGLAEFAEREGLAAFHEIVITRQIAPLRDLRSLMQLWRLMRRERFDLVHASTPKGGLLGTLAAWLSGVPVRVYTLRGLPLAVATGLKRRVLWFTDWLAMRLATRVTAISPSLRQEAIDLGLVSPSKIIVIGHGSSNGIDAERFVRRNSTADAPVRRDWDVPRDAIVIGFAGRIVRDKGFVELAQAWQRVREAEPRAHLVIVGTPEPEDPVPAHVLAELAADSRVRIPGFTHDMRGAFEGMDLLVLPTYREGFGNVLLEANAMELPVIATRIPGCVDAVVDGVTGVLVPPRDAKALGDALMELLSDPIRRAEMGRAGRERVIRDFRREDIWEGMWALYCSALAERPIGARS